VIIFLSRAGILQAMQGVRRALRMRRGGEDRPLVVLQPKAAINKENGRMAGAQRRPFASPETG